MSMIENVFSPEMFHIREKMLITALSSCAGAYYDFNVTKNLIVGTPIQVIDGKEYSIHEQIGMPPHCPYTDIIDYWGNQLAPEDQPAFFAFFDLEHLKKCYEQGEHHIIHTYWTKDVLGNPMLAEQNILLYEDITTGDLMGMAYVKDLKPIEEIASKEKEHMSIISALSKDYYSVYHINLDNGSFELIRMDNYIDYVNNVGNELASRDTFDVSFGAYIDKVIVPEDSERVKAILNINSMRKLLKDNSELTDTFNAVEEGKSHTYQYRLLRLGEADGNLNDAVLAFRIIDDAVSRDKEQQAILADALNAAEHANRAKTTFLNNMSHDIRTPMNAIIGFTALAASHIDDKEIVRDYLSKIQTSSSHLLSLINDVLDMSRIESGKVKIDEQAVHLPDILHDLRTIILSDMNSKQLEFLMDTVDVINEDIICDKLRLTQVLLNLISNAIKFTKPGGLVSVRVVQKNNAPAGYANYEFHVKDSGIGMSNEFVEHVFEPFERENTVTVSGIQGSGLGLAISKNIIDMMGGTISVKSEKDKGSEFTVCLQLKLSGSEVKYDVIPELKGLRALVADDDANSCMSISSMLETIGMRPEWTTSGKEAVIRTQYAVDRGDEFSAFIIDWLMPDMNGVETVRRIKRIIGENKPIIILTAYDWSEIEEEAREAGVTAFCSKPLFMSELRDLLTKPFRTDTTNAPKPEAREVDFTGKKILLVEDNELNQEIAVEILREAGFIMEVANDGEVAVDIMSKAVPGQYDLILMDIQMPIMNGYEATRAIRQLPDPAASSIPIIAMTANAFDEDKQEAMEAGMNGHISKPIEVSKLMETLAAILN